MEICINAQMAVPSGVLDGVEKNTKGMVKCFIGKQKRKQ